MTKIVPSKLYKYQSCNEYTFGNLRKSCLWFSKPEDFNDPFDCDINFEITDVTEENLKMLFEHMRAFAENKNGFDKKYLQDKSINETFKDDMVKFSLMATTVIKNKWLSVGVACLSEKYDDILMWSHYAYGHQGFCLEFDTSYSPFTENGKDTLIKVCYSDSYPPLSLSDILHNKLPPLPKNLLGTKSIHWGYEAEWRVFSSIGRTQHPYNKAALTAVYFGCKMKDSDKRTVASILADSPTKLFQMERSKDKFRVSPVEIFSVI